MASKHVHTRHTTYTRYTQLNPLRVSDAECAANAAQLLEMCQSFVAHVCRSSDYCPPYAPPLSPHAFSFPVLIACVVARHDRTVRRAFHVISMEVARRLPAMYLQSIANLLFLRFLSPALVTPRHGQCTNIIIIINSILLIEVLLLFIIICFWLFWLFSN